MSDKTTFDVFIDSDVFVGLFLPDDAHHKTVVHQFHQFEAEQTRLAVTNWVVAETATVLSYKDSQATAKDFLSMIETSSIPVLFVSREVEKETHRIFKDQTKKKTSMVDCSNVAIVKHYNIPRMFAFDGFYGDFNIKKVA